MVGAAGAARAAVEVEWVQLAGRVYGSWMPVFYLEDDFVRWEKNGTCNVEVVIEQNISYKVK